METSMPGSKDTMPYSSLLPYKGELSLNEIANMPWQHAIKFFTIAYTYNAIILKEQNAGLVTFAEALYYCNNTRENSEGEGRGVRKQRCKGNFYTHNTASWKMIIAAII